MESGVDFTAIDMPMVNRLTVHMLAAAAERATSSPSGIATFGSLFNSYLRNIRSIVAMRRAALLSLSVSRSRAA